MTLPGGRAEEDLNRAPFIRQAAGSVLESGYLRGDAAAMDDFGEGWMRWATRADQPYLVPDDAAPARTRDDFSQLRFDDLLDGIAFCRTVVKGRGLEMLVLDQTRTDTAMPVAKVVGARSAPRDHRLPDWMSIGSAFDAYTSFDKTV